MNKIEFTYEQLTEIEWALEYCYKFFSNKIGFENTKDLENLFNKISTFIDEITGSETEKFILSDEK